MKPDDALKAARDALAKAIEEKNNNKRLLDSLGPAVIHALTPILQQIQAAVSQIKVTVTPNIEVNPKIEVPPIKAPDVYIPPIQVPEPRVTVNVPEIKIPKIEMPKLDNIMGALKLTGWDKSFLDNPLPVQIRDAKGNPVSLGGGSTTVVGGVGGGGSSFPMNTYDPATSAIRTTFASGSSVSANIIDASGNIVGSAANPINVSLAAGSATSTQSIDSSGNPYSQANPLPIVNVGGAAGTSVSLVNADGNYYSSDNPLPVSASLSASLVQVQDSQASSITSHQFNTDFRGLDVYIGGSFESSFTQYENKDGRIRTDGSGVTQPVSGTVAVSGVTASVQSTLIDSSGIGYSGSNPVPVNLVSQSLASSASTIVDSSGVGYSGSNPVPITWVSGSPATVGSSIVDSTGVQYSGSNPVPITVVSGAATTTNAVLTRQSNPTPVAADYVPLAADDLGRQITRPIQIRDLIFSSYTTLSTGSETTIAAATAGSYNDLIYVMAANTSSAAQQVDFRAVTGGNIVFSLYIPAQSTIGFALPVGLPAGDTGNNWTADNADVTNSNVLITAMWTREA